MTQIEKSLKVNCLYYGIQLTPLLVSLFGLNVNGWLWAVFVFASVIWHNAIWVWLRRWELDLPLLGV